MTDSQRSSIVDLTIDDSDEVIDRKSKACCPLDAIDLTSPVPFHPTDKKLYSDAINRLVKDTQSSEQYQYVKPLFEIVTGKPSILKKQSTIDLASPEQPVETFMARSNVAVEPDHNSDSLGLSLLDLLAIQEKQHGHGAAQHTKRDMPIGGEVRSPFLEGIMKRQKASSHEDILEDPSERLETDTLSESEVSSSAAAQPAERTTFPNSTQTREKQQAKPTHPVIVTNSKSKTKAAVVKSITAAPSNTLDKFLKLPAQHPVVEMTSPTPTASSLLQAGYEVVLFVDKREKSHDTIIASLLAEKVKCELRTLAVGDFLWVARPSAATATSTRPIGSPGTADDSIFVLDCIAERKTIADLVSSVLDGRYKEQKSRLASLPIPHCFYIVEAEYMAVNPFMQVHCPSMNIESVKTAMVSTNVQDKMHVVRTRGGEHTVRTLVQITRQVQRRFLAAAVANTTESQLMSFSAFQQSYLKQHCADCGECLTHMIRQVRGCSLPSATALSNQFGTMKKLGKFFREVDRGFAMKFLANLHRHDGPIHPPPSGDGKRNEEFPMEDENEENDVAALNGAGVSGWATGIATNREVHRDVASKRIRKRIGEAVAKLICDVFVDEY
eukprot:gene26769-32347_t